MMFILNLQRQFDVAETEGKSVTDYQLIQYNCVSTAKIFHNVITIQCVTCKRTTVSFCRYLDYNSILAIPDSIFVGLSSVRLL